MAKDSAASVGKLTYTYRFVFPDGKMKSLEIVLDRKKLNVILPSGALYPAWVRLNWHKCSICPLDEVKVRHCPVAASMVSLIDFCKDMQSYQHTRVSVEAEQRTYTKNAPLQEAISSLLGVCMAAGGCPVLSVLKPMVRFHLPFADMEETAYRVFSMYLLSQYFGEKSGLKPDWKMEKLSEMYKNISKVNSDFCERLRSAVTSDAGVNAVIILDAFSSFIQFSIKRNALKDLQDWFTIE